MMKTSLPLSVAWVCCALLVPAVSGADVLHLKTGTLEGKVIEKSAEHVKFRTVSGIVTTIDVKDILAIEKRETPRDIYHIMAGKVEPDDAEAHYALATWCRDHSLKDEMAAELTATIKADPDHERARRELGYVKTDEGWMKRDAAMRAKGMVLVNGRWVTKSEAERVEQKNKNKRLIRTINTIVYEIRSAPRSKYKEWEERLANFDQRSVGWKIMELLDHDVAAVRRAACASLAKMNHHDAVPRLVRRTLFARDESVREAGLEAALRLDKGAACEQLYQTIAGLKLQTLTTRSEQKAAERLYHRIALALKAAGDLRSVPFLIQILYPSIEMEPNSEDQDHTGGIKQLGIRRSSIGLYPVGVENYSILMGNDRRKSTPDDADEYYFNRVAEEALKQLTGQDLGVLPKAWNRWWGRHGAELLRVEEAENRGSRDKAEKLLEEVADERSERPD